MRLIYFQIRWLSSKFLPIITQLGASLLHDFKFFEFKLIYLIPYDIILKNFIRLYFEI